MPSEKKGLLDLKSTAEHELLPVRLVAHETISELFHFQIEAVATGSKEAAAVQDPWRSRRTTSHLRSS